MRLRAIALACTVLSATMLYASVFGSVRGIVHDPDHRAIPGAQIALRSRTSVVALQATSDEQGAFSFASVPAGEYVLTISAQGFAALSAEINVTSDRTLELHEPLQPATVNQSVTVSTNVNTVDLASTSTTAVDAQRIERSAGADATNSMAMITDNVPSAVMVHDQLHIRGGHQMTWLIDGVPVPNTNIASNIGPQFDPKDVAYLEAQTGAYSAAKGDGGFGAFNVVPRSGFERDALGEAIVSYGSQNTTDDQINLGDHTDRFSYYASLGANRTDAGLMPPVFRPMHDSGSGESAFVSLIFNATPSDQLRYVGSGRNDHFQVPNDFGQQAAGMQANEDERDSFHNFTWLHTFSGSTAMTVSPFFHFNEAHYTTGEDAAVYTNSDRGSNYIGGSSTLSVLLPRNSMRAGIEGFAQRENDLFAVDDAANALDFRARPVEWGSNIAGYAEDQFTPWTWLTVNAGLRLTRFRGAVSESAVDPRIGGSVTVPKVRWVLHAFYGHSYQAPPLFSVGDGLSGALGEAGVGFLPLYGERDIQREAGLTIPLREWTVAVTQFQTSSRNFFDHDALGNSDVFLPLTITNARLHGTEVAVRSPRIGDHGRLHLVYSRQYAQARGDVSGGLTDFEPADGGYFLLDHDQRDTLRVGGEFDVRHTWSSLDFNYGSGFLDGDGPAHLPPHSTVDFAIGHDFGERWSAKLTATNLFDARYLIDNSNSFGGTHTEYPRRVAVQVRWRFHY